MSARIVVTTAVVVPVEADKVVDAVADSTGKQKSNMSLVCLD